MKALFSEVLVLFIFCSSNVYSEESDCEVRVTSLPEENTYVLLNSIIYMNCTADSNKNIRWTIRLSDSNVDNGFVYDQMRLNNHGFYNNVFILNNGMTKRITLLINNTAEGNNNTQVTCQSSETMIFTTTIFITEPAAINSIHSEDIHLQSINISWDPHLHDRVQTYSIRVMNSSNNAQPRIHKFHQPYYVFIAPDGAPPCEVYNFSVTATYVGASYTGAGCSVPSPVLSRMLPSLPNIERMNSSLTYSPVLNHGDLKLNVSFESGLCCEEYPILNYTLEVRSSSPSEVVTHSITPHHHNLIGNLSENKEYSFKIVVVNAVDNVSLSVKEFNTADVQLVTATFDKNRNGFLVQCDFMHGSDASGCMVVLVGESDNTTVNLTRLSAVAVEFINITCPTINYKCVIGYDIESDNKSIGPLAVHGRLLFNNSIHCPQINHELRSSLSILLAIMIPMTAITIIIIITVIASLIKRSKTGTFRPSVQSTLGSTKLQPPSQPQQDKERLETEEPQQTMPLYALPKESNVADKGVVGDIYYTIPEFDQNDNVMIKGNITTCTYAEITDKDPEHFYHTLENAKKVIPLDPDAPELPPPFKPEPFPPPVYHDILDLTCRKQTKGHTTAQNE